MSSKKAFFWSKFSARLTPTWLYILNTGIIDGDLSSFLGAALFSSITGSTITLDSEVPSLLENSGDYIQFDIFNTTGALNTVFGSTTTNQGVLLSTSNLQVVSGSTTGQLDFDTSLPTGWNTIKIINSNGSTLSTYLNGNLQTDTSNDVAINVDLIGKNTPRYGDVYGVQLNNLVDGDYLYKNSPDINLYGDQTGFWRAGSFWLDGSGSRCVADCMNGASGWRVDVVNTFLSYHRLRFLVGDGTNIYDKYDDTLLTEGSWVHWYVDLRQVTGLASGEIGFTGSFTPETGRFNLGYNRESGWCFAGKQDTVIGGTGYLTTAQQDWFFNSGDGRCLDEFTAVSTLSSGLLSVGYELSEINGIRYDSFGSNHLTESPVYFFGPNSLNGDFEDWVDSSNLSSWTEGIGAGNVLSQESGIVYNGNYSAKISVGNSSNNRYVRSFADVVVDQEYTFSLWAAFTGASIVTGSTTFQVNFWNDNQNFTIQDTGWSQYTYTFSRPNLNGILQINAPAVNGCSAFFDKLEIQSSTINRTDGLRTSFSRKDTFDGYLRNIKFYTSLYENGYNLYSGAQDTGNELNHGTPYSVDFVSTDPDPSG